MSLDPPKSDKELLELAQQRGGKVSPLPTDEEMLRRAEQHTKRQLGRPIECETPVNLDEVTAQVLSRRIVRRGEISLGRLTTNLKAGQVTAIDGVIYGAARSKKNHKVHYTKQAPGYRHWRDGVKRAFQIPRKPTLPASPLNLCAEFYVDSRGKPADLVGLLQGFADALEDAGVVTDDGWIQGFDGSRKRTHDPGNPRVVFSLHPLEEADERQLRWAEENS